MLFGLNKFKSMHFIKSKYAIVSFKINFSPINLPTISIFPQVAPIMLANIAKHKVPKYIRFVDSFPMNAAGKILKYKMREDAIEYLGLQDASKIVTA